jgi:hypothetical protein
MLDDPVVLTEQARRCRRLASSCCDDRTRDGLTELAGDYERRAEASRDGRDGRPAAR